MRGLRRILFSGALLLACAGSALWLTQLSALKDVPSASAARHHLFLPVAHSVQCRTHTAQMSLSASATTLWIGKRVTVTARLNNMGCIGLGIPRYWLQSESDATQPVVEPITALDVVHYLAVPPLHHDEATFVLRAVKSGHATLRAYVSFEVHLGYPGPAYWGGSTSPPLVVTVAP